MNNKNDDDIFVGKDLKFSLMFSLIFIIVLIGGLLIYMLVKKTKKYKCVNGACVECLDFETGCQDNCYMCSAQTSLYKPVCKNGKCTCEQCETNDYTCIFSKDTCNKKLLDDVVTCNDNSFTCDSGTCKKYAKSSPAPSFCYRTSANCQRWGCDLRYKCDSNLTCSVAQSDGTLNDMVGCTSMCKITNNPCQDPPIYNHSNAEELCKSNNCLKIEIGIDTLNSYVQYLLTLVPCDVGIRFFETMPPNFPTCAKYAGSPIENPLNLSIDNNNNLCINGTFSTSIIGLETLTGVKNIRNIFYNDVLKLIQPNDVLNIDVENVPVKIYFVKGIPANRSDCTQKSKDKTGNITGIRLFIDNIKPNSAITIKKNNNKVPLNATALWPHISKCINSLLCRWPILIQRIVDLDMSSCGIWKNGGKNKCCPSPDPNNPRSNSIQSDTINLSHYNIPIEISAKEAAYSISISNNKKTFTLGLGTVTINKYTGKPCSIVPEELLAEEQTQNCGVVGCISSKDKEGILYNAKKPGDWTITIGAALLKNITQLGADNIMNTILTIINKKSITIKIGTATYTLGQKDGNIELTCSSYNTENCGDKGIYKADNCQKCTIKKNPDVVFGKISVQSKTINTLIETVLTKLTCDKKNNSLSCTINNFSIPITINGFRVTDIITAKCENAILNLGIGFKVTINIEHKGSISIKITNIKLNNISLDNDPSCNSIAWLAGKISKLLKNFISSEIQNIVDDNINKVPIKLSGLFSNLSLSCDSSTNGPLIKLISISSTK